MHRLHVVLHLVGPGELLGADRTGEDFALLSLVVEERVPLEAVFILEGLLYVHFGALRALIHALGYRRVSEQIQPSDRHLGQLLGRILRLRGGPAPHSPLGHLSTRGCVHSATGRRRIGVLLRSRRRARARRRGRRRRGCIATAAAARRRRITGGRRRRGRRIVVRGAVGRSAGRGFRLLLRRR